MSKRHLVILGSFGVLFAWFFAPALSGESTFAYRDAAHYFHPLFQWSRGEWAAGRVPLWNPYENLGVPLVAENTASIFYPLQLIFALPAEFTLLYNVYAASHVALAGWGAYRLARHWQATDSAAALAALSYAFCGNVLFAHANAPFLVGAAWLPWGALAADRMLSERRWARAVILGAVLALVVLGGDPQIAYNIVLLAALYAIVLWRTRRAGADRADPRASRFGWPSAPALIAVSVATCGLLAAVQILPSLEAGGRSARHAYDSPRSIFELAAQGLAPRGENQENPAPWYAGLVGKSPEGHERQIYQFSVGPWRAIEYVWPNVAGRQFPTHRRWLGGLPAEGRVWVPSLYMGLFPLLLAASAWTLRPRAPAHVRWMAWAVLASALASTGVYGAGWWFGEVTTWLGQPRRLGIGDEVGGAYWLATVLLPGYVYFRYPAKLLVVTSLGLSMLAARGWDEAWQSGDAKMRRWLGTIFTISLVGLASVGSFSKSIVERMDDLPADPVFGPMDASGALADIMAALAQSAVIAAVCWALLRWRVGPRAARVVPTMVVLVTALDLAIAQRWLVPYGPAELWNAPLPAIINDAAGDAPRRVFRPEHWLADTWKSESSTERLAEIVRWDRATLRPKYPLPERISLLEASGTMAPYDEQMVLDVARRHGTAATPADWPDESVLDLLGANLAVSPTSTHSTDYQPLGTLTDGAMLYRRPNALPRSWIVHDVEALETLKAFTPSQIRRRTEEVLFPEGEPRDWRRVAVVETDEPMAELPEPSGEAVEADGERCEIVRAEESRVEIMARLRSPGLVVIADLDAPGWELTVETAGDAHSAEILRTNRVMRGVVLPAGDHRLFYRYRPTSVILGGAVSAAAVAAFIALVVAGRWRRGIAATG